MTRKIIHIDMDCFYAAIEMRDDPSLKKKAIAVGGSAERRGVICTANYEARKYGVHSAMSSAYAQRLCPHLLIIKPQMAKYKQVSQTIFSIFKHYTDLIEPLSLDEAYLDVTECDLYANSATHIAQAIRQDIFQQCQLQASAGIAPNKFLAKVASDWRKPNGQFVIPPKAIANFMKTLAVSKIRGVGKVMQEKLSQRNIKTCDDLQQFSQSQLYQEFGSFGSKLYQLCRGEDSSIVTTERIRKSLSVEHTYEKDIKDALLCHTKIEALFNELELRLLKHQDKIIKQLFMKIKFSDFSITTVSHAYYKPELAQYYRLLELGLARSALPVRLLGIGVGFQTVSDAKRNQLSFDFS